MSMLFNYIGMYILFAVIGAVFYIPFRLLYLKKKDALSFSVDELFRLLFFSSVFAVLSQTAFPDFAVALMPGELSVSVYYPRLYINISNLDFNFSFHDKISTSFNLIPFRTIASYFSESDTFLEVLRAVINIIGNVCLFIPVGFLFPLSSKKVSLKRFIIFVLLLILAIEAVQFYVGRSADIDDLILNLLGALCGYLGCCIVKKIGKRFCHK